MLADATGIVDRYFNGLLDDQKSIANKPSKQKLYGIGLRRVNGIAVAWRVTISRRGTHIDRSFRISSFRGIDEALSAAIAFRDEVNQRFPPLTKQEQHAIRRSSNTSGVPGVIRTATNEWKARIKFADGTQKTRQFAIHLYGDEEAKRLAVQARVELLKQVRGHIVRHEENLTIDFPQRSEPILAITPHKDKPAASPYEISKADKVVGIGRVNIRTVLSNGDTSITQYRVAEFRQSGGLPKRRYFSIARYGEDTAFLMAIEQRQAWEREALAYQRKDQICSRERRQSYAAALNSYGEKFA